jgi:nitrate/nitrite-specific signal transduction histidine kinase
MIIFGTIDVFAKLPPVQLFSSLMAKRQYSGLAVLATEALVARVLHTSLATMGANMKMHVEALAAWICLKE